jgi:hypothetical protein
VRSALVGAVAVLRLAGSPGPAHGQTTWPWTRDSGEHASQYEGGFTFLRIQYETEGGGGLLGFDRRRGSRGEAPWEHDRPRAERNFAKILEAATFVDARQEEEAGIFLRLDDPELFKYPAAYIVEVGFWRPDDAEVRALREYLLKGGFLIVDDFRGTRELVNFANQMRRVLPEYHLHELTGEQEVFDSFFHIPDPTAMIPYYDRDPAYLGIFEDDDSSKRLMVIVNYNNDLAEYWEFSDRGYVPIDLSNEAYKFGVNYIIYAMTH